MTFRFAQIVGSYRLVVTSQLRVFIEQTFVEHLPIAERDMARTEALAEASASEIEFTPDGVFISRCGAQVFFRVRLNLALADYEQLEFEKSPGERVSVRRLDDDTLLALQPGRPPAEFRRL